MWMWVVKTRMAKKIQIEVGLKQTSYFKLRRIVSRIYFSAWQVLFGKTYIIPNKHKYRITFYTTIRTHYYIVYINMYIYNIYYIYFTYIIPSKYKYRNQNTLCKIKCLRIDFIKLFFLIVISVMCISVSELQRFFPWTPLNYQGVQVVITVAPALQTPLYCTYR
jgi:hypothetical protein